MMEGIYIDLTIYKRVIQHYQTLLSNRKMKLIKINSFIDHRVKVTRQTFTGLFKPSHWAKTG